MNKNNEPLSHSEFVRSLEGLKPRLSLPETEESWEKILSALEELEKHCQPSACEYSSELISSVRSIHRNITSAMSSERTRLSGAALDAIAALALCLNADFEPLMSLFLPGLILLCGRTNKVVVSRAKACILTIIDVTQLPSILVHLAHFVKDKSPTIRLVVTEGTLSCLKCFNPPDLEKEVYSRSVEDIIRVVVRDANADIRRVGKAVFQSYKVLLPHRVDGFTAPLTPTIRKYLQLGAGDVSAQARGIASVAPKTNPTSKRTVTSQPIHPAKTCSETIPKLPSNVIRLVAPQRSVHAQPKRREDPGAKAPDHQQPQSRPLTRPFPPAAANTTGPRRVIKSFIPSAVGQTTSLAEKHTSVVTSGGGPTRPEKPTHPTALTGSIIHPSNSKPTNPTRQQVPGKEPILKRGTTINTGRATTRPGDVTRPTLSQLARVRSVVTRPVKPVQGLNIHKAKSSVHLDSTRAGRLPGASNAQTRQTCAFSTKGTRPNTPASIPLPASPEPAPTEDPNPGMQEDLANAECNVAGSEAATKVPTPKNNDTLTPQGIQIKGAVTPALDDRVSNFQLSCKTPISALLSSIQQGFDLTPCSPLSPAQQYASSELDSPSERTPFQLGIVTSSVMRP